MEEGSDHPFIDMSGKSAASGVSPSGGSMPTTEPQMGCIHDSTFLSIMQNLDLVDDLDLLDPLSDINCSSSVNYSTGIYSGDHGGFFGAAKADHIRMHNIGLYMYAYITPFIILVGLIGNIISLRVFTSRRMRQMSASLYLAALASSDSLTLIVFVFFDWLPRGLPKWPGNPDPVNVQGINTPLCQIYVYLSYIFRFLSSWIIVLFTGERYIGVCKPLHRRAMCTNSFAKKAIVSIVLVAALLSVYKPLLVNVQEARTESGVIRFCTRKEGKELVTFALDAVYGTLIAIVPFSIITVLNLLIMRRLRLTRRRHLRAKFASEETTIRLEFTAILMVVSTTFIVLNLPYFVLWCYNYDKQLAKSVHMGNPTEAEHTRGWVLITKTIFYANYCINFFIYSLTGGYFRKQLRALCINDTSCCAPNLVPNAASRPSATGFNGNVATTSTTHIPLQPSRGL